LVRKEKEKRGEETMSNHQAILFMALEGKKIYVPSYSKEFIKDLCYVFKINGMRDKIQDYTSDTEITLRDGIWAMLTHLGRDIRNGSRNRFFGKALWCSFCIIGDSSAAEVQFQLLHRVRHTKENKLYLWIDKPGEGKKGIPSKKQIRKELDKKHEDGKKMAPLLLLMPPWLKNLYICKLQDIHRSKRKLNKEVNIHRSKRKLNKEVNKEHYVTKDIGIIKTNDMQVIKYPVPDFSSIRKLDFDECSKVCSWARISLISLDHF